MSPRIPLESDSGRHAAGLPKIGGTPPCALRAGCISNGAIAVRKAEFLAFHPSLTHPARSVHYRQIMGAVSYFRAKIERGTPVAGCDKVFRQFVGRFPA